MIKNTALFLTEVDSSLAKEKPHSQFIRVSRIRNKSSSVIALLACLILPHCTKSHFEAKNQSIHLFKVSCAAAQEPSLVWQWCHHNIITGSSIGDVCVGQVQFKDREAPAIFLNNEKSDECWIGHEGTMDGPVTADCDQQKTRVYERLIDFTSNASTSTEIVECYYNNQLIRVSGSLNESRTEFVATKPLQSQSMPIMKAYP